MKFYKFNENLIYVNNENNSKVILENVVCKIIDKPYKKENKWYMKVKILDDNIKYIENIDKTFEKTIENEVQKALFNDILILKIPYRYNKFECKTFDKDLHYISCYELKENDNIECNMTHACFSLQKTKYLSTWKVNQIKLKD